MGHTKPRIEGFLPLIQKIERRLATTTYLPFARWQASNGYFSPLCIPHLLHVYTKVNKLYDQTY